MDSPFFHYHALFDAQETVRRHEAVGRQPTAGMLTNYLGVVIDPKFFPSILDNLAGQVEPVPIPANWHADIAEWAAALRAVELAGETFTAIELGCGWACWLNNTGVAARAMGKRQMLIGVEGDEGHIKFARESTQANGFTPGQVQLYRGIAAGSTGVALFPRQVASGQLWDLQPVFGASAAQQAEAERLGTHDILPMISLSDIVRDLARVDLLHIDIQGGEAALIESCIGPINEKVSYLLVGTHSREIEGQLFDRMLAEGWELEIERPAILRLEAGKTPFVTVDGVQGWRNKRLSP